MQTSAPPTVGSANREQRPGWGKGDKNHDHTGPPGQRKQESEKQDHESKEHETKDCETKERETKGHEQPDPEKREKEKKRDR